MPHSPETVAHARRLYADGASIAAIEAETGMKPKAQYYWYDGGRSVNGKRQLPPLPRRRRTSPAAADPPTDRNALVARLWRTAEAQVREIEARLAADAPVPADRERDARTLAVLVKTLRELAAFDEHHAAAAPQSDDADADDSSGPLDLDDLRRELARRIDLLRRERGGSAAGGPVAADDPQD